MRGLLNEAYDWKCLDCPRTKNFGASRLLRDIDAGKHRRRFPDHAVQLRTLIVTYTLRSHAANMLPGMPNDLDEPPF